jgi:hypothetical protein
MNVLHFPVNLQMFDDPLHDSELHKLSDRDAEETDVTHIVHHLHKGNEEDDGRKLEKYNIHTLLHIKDVFETYDVHEEKTLADDFCVKKECRTHKSLTQEIRSQSGHPFENRETGA